MLVDEWLTAFPGQALRKVTTVTEDTGKTRSQLVAELAELRQRVSELEAELQVRPKATESTGPGRPNHHSLVDNAAYGIYVTSVEDRFVTANPALAEMLGYDSVAELLAVKPSEVYEAPEVREKLIDTYRDAERVEGVEATWRRRDESRITVRLSGRPVHDSSGELEGFELIAEDITHQRRLEDQLRQAQKMEAVGRLTGGIAHDFNNLLAVILSNVELIGQALTPDANRARAELDDLRSTAERGASMIKKLLGFSRHDELELRDVDLRALVADMSRMIDRLLPDDVEVIVAIDDTVGYVSADEGAIEQIMLNLATNARDAMPKGGRLNVELRRQYLDAAYCAQRPWVKEGEYVCLSVIDTGIGMDEEVQRQIFEPFFTTKPADAGTGLGMSMVYGLVKQHGGFVHVYSEVGHGTSVKVHFPEVGRIQRRASRRATYDPRELTGSATILLTEDETALRRAAKRVLESQGYTVFAAADGEEALAALEAHPTEINLVISDLVMPKLGGAELYQVVRTRQPAMPFLLTSGFSTTEMQERSNIDPAVPCLQKPWTVTELLWSVRDALEGEVGEAA